MGGALGTIRKRLLDWAKTRDPLAASIGEAPPLASRRELYALLTRNPELLDAESPENLLAQGLDGSPEAPLRLDTGVADALSDAGLGLRFELDTPRNARKTWKHYDPTGGRQLMEIVESQPGFIEQELWSRDEVPEALIRSLLDKGQVRFGALGALRELGSRRSRAYQLMDYDPFFDSMGEPWRPSSKYDLVAYANEAEGDGGGLSFDSRDFPFEKWLDPAYARRYNLSYAVNKRHPFHRDSYVLKARGGLVR